MKILKKLFFYPGPLWVLYSLFGYVWMAVSCVVLGSTLMAYALGGGRRDSVFNAIMRWWFRGLVECVAIRYRCLSPASAPFMQNLGQHGYLVVSNHQSVLDIPVAFFALGGRIRMVAKKELSYIPFFGWSMRAAGYVFVNRKDPNSRSDVAKEIGRRLRQKMSIWVAPEGTRSRDGKLAPFRPGAFAMAIDAKMPILPLVVYNSREAVPKGSILMRPGTIIDYEILEPIATEAYRIEDKAKLAQDVFERIDAKLKAYDQRNITTPAD